MTFSTASSREKRSKNRKPASSSRRTTLPFNEEANSPALACKVPDRARLKTVSSQLDTPLRCHISTLCIFASFHFYCNTAKLCGYSSYILSSIHSTEEHNYNSLVQETLLSKVCTHLLTSSCSVPSPFSKPPCFFFSVPVPSGECLHFPQKLGGNMHRSIHFVFSSWHIALWVGLALSHLLQKMHIMKLAQTTGVKGSMPRIGLSQK